MKAAFRTGVGRGGQERGIRRKARKSGAASLVCPRLIFGAVDRVNSLFPFARPKRHARAKNREAEIYVFSSHGH